MVCDAARFAPGADVSVAVWSIGVVRDRETIQSAIQNLPSDPPLLGSEKIGARSIAVTVRYVSQSDGGFGAGAT